MGRNTVKLEAVGTTSSHNSINDELDAVRWKWFCLAVQDIAKDPNFSSLGIDVSFSEAYAGPYA